MDHHTTIHEAGEGGAQAVCSCGWRSPVFGTGKTAGTMDSLQATAAGPDLHRNGSWRTYEEAGHRSRHTASYAQNSQICTAFALTGIGPTRAQIGE